MTFTESVDGTGTVLTASVPLSKTQSKDKLVSLLNYPGDPKAIALYVKVGDTFFWGGVVQTRVWQRDKRAFSISASSWKSWLYRRFLQPNTATNPVTDLNYGWNNIDQFVIAQSIIGHAINSPGTPVITVGSETSGVPRTLQMYGSEFVYAGDAIDRMALREKGFEWDIEIRPDSAGNPSLYFAPYYPKKQGLNGGVIFKSTITGGNILAMSDPEDSAEPVVTRVWGTGTGTAGTDLLMAFDQDPRVTDDIVLLEESKEYTNTTTSNISTIASHVQGIRQFHASGLQQISVRVALDEPDFREYFVGNKVRLIIKDELLDIDMESVRIVRRTFRVNTETEDSVECLIDLNDTELPQNEEAL